MTELSRSLVPLPETMLLPDARIERARDSLLPKASCAGAAALGMFALGWSSAGVIVLVATMIAAGAIAVRSLVRDQERLALSPSAIQSLELRDAYRAVLRGLTAVDAALADAPAASPLATRLLPQARSATLRCARLAMTMEPVERYLWAHDRASLVQDIDALRERIAHAEDDTTVSSLARTIAPRLHQLATYDRMVVLRDQVRARIENVGSTFESLAATIVYANAVEEHQRLLDRAAALPPSIDDDLEILDEVLDRQLAA